ncbi:hypothetical protein SLEP1_g12751 [Rubroshorea leprosula]|uniref:Embryogenesis-associated protein EMB8 n=1 Tax=Rubroshorea leprosula TaxID=152421 RepID=A0AAV5IMP5_9ROSI|nr:hypothetical protein SLEP1_g12751 [Rubroshorea leprosula]
MIISSTYTLRHGGNLLCHVPFHVREFRVYKHRRLKHTRRNLSVHSHLNWSFDNFFQNLPSWNLLTPAFGLASGAALFLSSKRKLASESRECDIGEWILFTSPTPFNRFVIIRCPSISFEGGELMHDVNERLVKEDKHFVRLNSGTMIEVNEGGGGESGSELEYQRVCVNTEDGGVISLDWPANLDLKEEHGLDTTVLLVPGTVEGSMDENVRTFVLESLRRGFFPVVMNPRGCAGSPLTTPRLFTAADSDDISTAIQFINKARPWTTLMGVGWGFGANMLTKYLAEVGEKTPLTAATCIDNPFDLEEATRSIPHHVALDQKLAGGLVDILRSNKELFQGRVKGFNVEKALSVKSVRDFEQAISMVSYGFEAIEDFYSKSSTRSLVGDVKIPVLFIQNDDGTVPVFSIPRNLIAENPFTSLLLCSCSPCRAAISWYQHFTIEWLTAVELGLLKGRHPLLKDVDVTINPSRGLPLVERRSTEKGGEAKKLLDLTHLNAVNGYCLDPVREMLEDVDTAATIHPHSRQDSHTNLELRDKGLHGAKDDTLQTNSFKEELIKEEAGPLDGERSQMLQTAKVVMNMLDVTMPGTLKEEEKKKVQDAVGKGETIVQALQDAVPEDVRGKLTAAVTGIMSAQGTSLKQGIGRIPSVSVRFESKIEEKISSSHSAEEFESSDDPAPSNIQVDMEKTSGGIGSQLPPAENSQKSYDVDQSHPGFHEGDIPNTVRTPTNGSLTTHEEEMFTKEKSSAYSELSDLGVKPSFTNQPEKTGNTDEATNNENKADQDGRTAQLEMKDENTSQKKEEKNLDTPTDQQKTTSAAESSSESLAVEGQENDNQKKESKHIGQNAPTTFDSNSSTFSVAQALDALTGIDDSTQVAVNSVFGVIENVISQFEEEKVDENETGDVGKVEDKNVDSVPGKPQKLERKEDSGNDNTLSKKEGNGKNQSIKFDGLYYSPQSNHPEKGTGLQHDAGSEWMQGEPARYPISGDDYAGGYSHGPHKVNNLGMEKKNQLVTDKLVANYSDRTVNSIPLYIRANPYGDFLQNESFQRYLLSKSNNKALDLDTTTALLLDYFPEEGQWMLLEQPGTIGDSVPEGIAQKGVNQQLQAPSATKVNETEKVIEPSYVILETDTQHEPVEEYESMDNSKEVNTENGDSRPEELMQFVKTIMLDSLRVEVSRKLSVSDMKEMESQLTRDIETVATAVSLAVELDKEHTYFQGKLWNGSYTSGKVATICGKNIIRAVSSAVQETSYLRRVLPIGLVVGSSLAGLRKYFNVSTIHDDCEREGVATDKTEIFRKKSYDKTSIKEIDQKSIHETGKLGRLHSPTSKEPVVTGLESLNSDGVVVGAVTAALGASALLVHKQDSLEGKETAEILSKSFGEKGNQHKYPDNLEETIAEKHENNVVTSLAEKAMSVAGPVVPTKEDGEVDHESRLVAMLTELGQRGGMLRLVGKVALLWGGLRGAMSLTDRLIMFLHIAERPLLQRILGFVSLALLLWSPVVVPLLPTLVQSWTTNNPSKIAQFVSIVGFYTAVMILVMLWGKRIRGYENPLEQYGLDLTSLSKIQNFFKGLIGGVLLVGLIQFVNALLGCVSFTGPLGLLSSTLDAMTWFKEYGKLLMLAVQGFVTATGVGLVEELLFRSWLPEEIATDLGYHQGIILSGLAFSLFQRSFQAIPGLWLLSLALAGIREQSKGSLSVPIGFRTGIMASSFVLQTGGFLVYKPNFTLWVTGTHPFQPFSGVVGLAFSFLLAVIFYPTQPQQRKNLKRTMQE